MTENRYVVGVDLGGTNMRVAVFNGPGHDSETSPSRPVALRKEPVGDHREPEHVVDEMAQLITSLLAQTSREARGAAVGVGIAAMLEGRDGVVANSPHLGWRDVPFGALLRERLGDDYTVAVHNDVNAATWGEYRCGAGQGVDDVLAVFVGTGIGSGIIANGQLVLGHTGCAAELGHMKVVYGDDAARCNCGLRGCVEAYIGGSYLLRRTRRELSGKARSLAVQYAGGADRVTPGHIDAAAAEGDEYALDLYSEIAPHLGTSLANAVSLLNPARLILGGGVLSRAPVLCKHVVAALEVAVNPPAGACLEIVDAALGDDAGLIGAALLAVE